MLVGHDGRIPRRVEELFFAVSFFPLLWCSIYYVFFYDSLRRGPIRPRLRPPDVRWVGSASFRLEYLIEFRSDEACQTLAAVHPSTAADGAQLHD